MLWRWVVPGSSPGWGHKLGNLTNLRGSDLLNDNLHELRGMLGVT